MPSVQTLDGMSRQGNYIGMTQRCKHFLETVYSVGPSQKELSIAVEMEQRDMDNMRGNCYGRLLIYSWMIVFCL
jgi:hypothetical protein